MAVGSVHDDHVAPRFHQGIDPGVPVRPVPTAAPTLSLPRESLQAVGYLMTFSMSFMVMSPFRLYSLSTTRSFSILCAVEHLLRLFEADPLFDGDEVLLGHHVLYLLLRGSSRT